MISFRFRFIGWLIFMIFSRVGVGVEGGWVNKGFSFMGNGEFNV